MYKIQFIYFISASGYIVFILQSLLGVLTNHKARVSKTAIMLLFCKKRDYCFCEILTLDNYFLLLYSPPGEGVVSSKCYSVYKNPKAKSNCGHWFS